MHRHWQGVLLVLLGAVAFSSKAIIIKLVYRGESMSAADLLAWRMILSAPFYLGMLVFLRVRGALVAVSLPQLLSIAFAGFFGYYLASFFDFKGLETLDAGLERLILFSYPAMVLLLSSVFLGRPIRSIHVISLVLTYSGIAIAAGPVSGAKEGTSVRGVLYILAAAFTYAVYLVFIESLLRKIPSLQLTSLAMLAATLCTSLHASATGPGLVKSVPGFLSHAGYVVLLAVFCTVLPSFAVTMGIRRVSADTAAIIGMIGPVITMVLAAWVLDEQPDSGDYAGTILVIAGVMLVSTRRAT